MLSSLDLFKRRTKPLLSIFRTGYLDLGDCLQLNLVFSEQGSGKGDRVGGIDGEIINNTDLIKVTVHLVDSLRQGDKSSISIKQLQHGSPGQAEKRPSSRKIKEDDHRPQQLNGGCYRQGSHPDRIEEEDGRCHRSMEGL